MMELFVFLLVILYKFLVWDNFNNPHNETRDHINNNINVKNQENIKFFVSLDGGVVPCDLEKNKKRLNTQKDFGCVLIDIKDKEVECLKDSKGSFVFFLSENTRIPIFSYIVTNQSTYFIFENEKKSYVYFSKDSNKKLSEKSPKFRREILYHNYYATDRCGLIKILKTESVEEYATCMIKQDNKIPLLRDKNGSYLRFFIDEKDKIPHIRFCYINNIFHLVFLNQNDENVYFFHNEDDIYQQNIIESDTLFFEDFKNPYYKDKKIVDIFDSSDCFKSQETVSLLVNNPSQNPNPSIFEGCDQVQNQRVDNSEDTSLKNDTDCDEKINPSDQNEDPNSTESKQNEIKETTISSNHVTKKNLKETINSSNKNVDTSTNPKTKQLDKINKRNWRRPKFRRLQYIEIGNLPQNEEYKPDISIRSSSKNTTEEKNEITSQELGGLNTLSPDHPSKEPPKSREDAKILGLQYENSSIQTENEQKEPKILYSYVLKNESEAMKNSKFQNKKSTRRPTFEKLDNMFEKNKIIGDLMKNGKNFPAIAQENDQKENPNLDGCPHKKEPQKRKSFVSYNEGGTSGPISEQSEGFFEEQKHVNSLPEQNDSRGAAIPQLKQGTNMISYSAAVKNGTQSTNLTSQKSQNSSGNPKKDINKNDQEQTGASNILDNHKRDSGVQRPENTLEPSLDLVFYQNLKKIYLDHQMRNLLDPERSRLLYVKTMKNIKKGFGAMMRGIITTHDNMKNGPLIENPFKEKHETITDEERKTAERTFSQKSKKILTDQEIKGFESNSSYDIMKNVDYFEYEKQGMWVFMNEIMKTETGYKWSTVLDQEVLKMFYQPLDCKNIYKKLNFKHPDYKKFIFYKYEYEENKENTTIIRSGILAIGENVKLNGFKYNGPVIVDHDVEIKQGVIINNGTYVGPYCTISNGCYIGSGCYFEKKVSICPHVSIKNRNYFHENSVIGYHTEDTKINKDINKLIELKNQLFFGFDTIIGSGNIFGRYCKLHRGSHVYFYNYIGANVILHPGVRIYMNNTILWYTEILKDSTIGIGNNILHYLKLDEGSNIGLYTHIFSYKRKIERYYMRGCAQIKCYIHTEELATEGHTTTNRMYRVNLSNTIITSLDDIKNLIIYKNIRNIKRIYILLDNKLDMRSLI